MIVENNNLIVTIWVLDDFVSKIILKRLM